MSDTTTSAAAPATQLPTIGQIATGLVVAAADVSPVSKTFAAVEQGAETFIQHNTDLQPILTGAEQVVSTLAEKHGLSTVWSIMQDLFPFLANLGHTQTTVHSS